MAIHWLGGRCFLDEPPASPSALRPGVSAVVLSECRLRCPEHTTPHLHHRTLAVKLAHEMTSHDEHHVNIFVSHEQH